MPLSPNFSVSQIIGRPSVTIITDESTGSDVAIVSRRIYFKKYDNTNLTGTPASWALALTDITLDLLDKDYAINVQCDWLDVDGVVLYTKTLLFIFQRYNIEFDFSLSYSESVGLASINSPNWLRSRIALKVAIDDANNAISQSASITDSQSACDRGTYLRLNPNLFY
jgi:hypothetical protein